MPPLSLETWTTRFPNRIKGEKGYIIGELNGLEGAIEAKFKEIEIATAALV